MGGIYEVLRKDERKKRERKAEKYGEGDVLVNSLPKNAAVTCTFLSMTFLSLASPPISALFPSPSSVPSPRVLSSHSL